MNTKIVSEPLCTDSEPRVTAWIDAQPLETSYLSAIVVAELCFGVLTLPAVRRQRRLHEWLEWQVFSLFTGRVLPFDLMASQAYAELLYINDADTAFETVNNALSETAYNCILVGAGVRTVDEHFIVFERLVNAVHQSAPSTKICFNTNPRVTAETVKRRI